jgi:hypothetical protein
VPAVLYARRLFVKRRMPQTALHLGADPRHKTIANFLLAVTDATVGNPISKLI